MNIIIAGMGVVGRHVAKELSLAEHNLFLVDQSNDALELAAAEIDAIPIRGHAANERTLRQAGVEACDLFMAVTNNDEVNLIAALRAKNMGATRVIARATDPVYFEEERGLYHDMFGIDLVINPKFLVALEIHKLIRTHGAVAVEDFANNQIEMVQLSIEQPGHATTTKLSALGLPHGVQLVAVLRGRRLIIPRGDVTLQVGDKVLCVGRVEVIPEVERFFGFERDRMIRKVIIVGGGEIGASLARYVESDGIKVTVVDQDRLRCVELSEMLSSRTEILHGDGTNASLLEELGVATCDFFVAVSQADEVNLMTSLLAQSLGADHCISLVHKPDYAKVLERFGLHAALSPRRLVAGEVLKHVRQGNLLSVNTVMRGRGEFLELLIDARSPIVDGLSRRPQPRKLDDLNFPRDARICAVFGDEGAFIPNGKTVFEPGQRVVVFTTPQGRPSVERFF